jgi:hypothetical protein
MFFLNASASPFTVKFSQNIFRFIDMKQTFTQVKSAVDEIIADRENTMY